MYSVIMAGGVGQRFWPRSRRHKPKQLLDLTGRGTMLSLTVERLTGVSRPEEIFIVTTAEQLDAVVGEVGRRVPRENIIGEPVGKNTAPSIGIAALAIHRSSGDVPFMVLPADHLIDKLDRFTALVRAAEAYVARSDCLLTFGIPPSRPETGYGYIQAGEPIAAQRGIEMFRAASFTEKPTVEKARSYVEKGNYLWNSGMFLWRTEVILAAIERHIPELHAVLVKIKNRTGTEPLDAVLKSTYSQSPAISIDYGVMERADNVVVLKADFYWNDIGSWESIREIYPEDGYGNVLVGNHLLIDSRNNTIFSPERLVGILGLNDVVVVDGGNALLVCRRDRVQQVREIVDALVAQRKKELT